MATPTPAAPTSKDVIINSIITNGDLSKLSQDQKTSYYKEFCERLGLDPLSQPFKILRLNGRETLYCDRTGTQQLCKLHSVSHEIRSRETVHGCYVVTAQASTPDGRHTESIGAVPIENLKGENLCNAMMKGETKAKRRATLDLLGLGVLDETEVDSFAPESAKQDAPVAQETAPEKKVPLESKVPASPEKKAPAKNPPAKSAPAKSALPKEPVAREVILEALNGAKDVEQLEAAYYQHQDVIETDVQLKQLSRDRKKALDGKPVATQLPAADPNRFSLVYKTKEDVTKVLESAINVDQLTTLFKANETLVATENLKPLFTQKRQSFAKAVLDATPEAPSNDELVTRPVEWFAKRMNKEIWMQMPTSGYTGRIRVESDDYPRWLAEEKQAEGAKFRDVRPDDPQAPVES